MSRIGSVQRLCTDNAKPTGLDVRRNVMPHIGKGTVHNDVVVHAKPRNGLRSPGPWGDLIELASEEVELYMARASSWAAAQCMPADPHERSDGLGLPQSDMQRRCAALRHAAQQHPPAAVWPKAGRLRLEHGTEAPIRFFEGPLIDVVIGKGQRVGGIVIPTQKLATAIAGDWQLPG